MVGFALLALIAAAVVVADVMAGDAVQALIWAVATLMFAHLAGLAASMMHRPAASTRPPVTGTIDDGERGLAFAYSRSPYYWLGAVLISVVLAAAGFAIAFAAQGTVTGLALTAIFTAFALFLGWFLTVIFRLAPGVVILTPSGIYHRGLALEHFVPWDAVADILAREGRTPWITVKALPTPTTRQRSHIGRLGPGAQCLPFMIIHAHWLGSNAVPAYRALRQYFDNPSQRAYLGGIERPNR
ncbi:hypothetical protein OWR29_39245 [Actinoplanes sp. Pm04-4]|uniref:PH domain-containing protein n=1 Tax=Paractinoplanes pyxinae TaxID=2997416 RepID=A0ABT4BC25_9ACTN|nr:hypothetical protein [Actinoplanes pyxinae]MCY1144068.1 hypothetical protein [Actinoplanes pyxinae]